MTTNGQAAAADKDFDLVLFGATGFTGRLVAEVLTERNPRLRWALAGRSRDKLEAVRADLAAIAPAAASIPILVGDSLDPSSVDALVRRARVICTTVGPYAKYGAPLVAACAAHGVHYCDLTGETHFVRASIDAHHDRAAETGARIVPCCGFDSIPSDLGVLMLHEHLAKQGKRLGEAHYRVMKMKGGPSGGTIASVLEVAAAARTPAVRRVLADPYALDPKGTPRGLDVRDSMGPRRDPDTGRWTAPFVMAAINTRIVRRSNALLGHAYGEGFRYDEAVDTGPGPRGLARAVGSPPASPPGPPQSRPPRAAPSSAASSLRPARAPPASSARTASSASRSTPPPPAAIASAASSKPSATPATAPRRSCSPSPR